MSMDRVRRRPEDARRLILEAAEQLLVEGGPGAVTVRAVAERVGVTDAGVAHHFGSRDELQVALLKYGGRRLRAAVADAADGWVEDRASVADLVSRIAAVYADGYGELAIALHAAGWRDDGGGLLDPVVDLLHASRRRRPGQRLRRQDTQLAVAALHLALATDHAYGAAFRRSAGVAPEQAERPDPQQRWWVATISAMLDVPAESS